MELASSHCSILIIIPFCAGDTKSRGDLANGWECFTMKLLKGFMGKTSLDLCLEDQVKIRET